jgi:hypothetical protein
MSRSGGQGVSIDRHGASSRGWPGGHATVGRGARSTGAPPPAGSCPSEVTRPNPGHRAHMAASGPRARTRPTGVDVTLLIVLALLIALDLVAWRWGHDSRDGQDWKT